MNKEFKLIGLEKDWQYGFVDDRFVIKINSSNKSNQTYKEACMSRAEDLYKNLKNPVLAIGGGTDSQVVLNCFYDQNYKIDCVFRYYKNYNTHELEWVHRLQKKYNFNLIQIDIDPDKIQSEILEEYEKTDIHPIELIYKNFISMLPEDFDVIQGIEGPFIVKGKSKLHYLDSYNTYGFLRRRAVEMLDRKGKLINFEKNSDILLATLQDEIYNSFLETYEYFEGHTFTKELKNNLIDQWDLYIKPFLYHKHWKNDIIYFPKYMGSESIPWLNLYRTFYRQRMILIELQEMKEFLKSGGDNYKEFYEHQYSFQDIHKEIELRRLGKKTYPISMAGELL
jgi:hypothetical protein